MPNFNVQTRGIRSESRPSRFTITEGTYRGGIYHLIKLDHRNLRVEFKAPVSRTNPSFLDGYSQALPKGESPIRSQAPLKLFWAREKNFKPPEKR